MSRFASLYGDQPAVDVLLTGPKRRRGQRVGFGVSLSPAEVRGAIDNNLIQGVQNRMGVEAERLVQGVIDVDEWYDLAAPLVRGVHYAAALAAVGGVDAFNDVHRAIVEGRIAEQLAYLANFAAELKSGKQPLNGFVPVRARMYGDAAIGTYEAVRRGAVMEEGFTLERRVLNVRAANCPECKEMAALEWVPIGTLPDIGVGSRCKNGCRCSFEYLRNAEDETPLPSALPVSPRNNGQQTEEDISSAPPGAVQSTSQVVNESPILAFMGDVLKVVPGAEEAFVASLSRYWKPQGTGWVHVDGTRIEKTVSGAFKVISRAGDELRTFRTAEAAFRFVDGGGLELATDARGHEHKGKGPGGGEFTTKGKKLFHGTSRDFDKPVDGSYWTSNEKAANVYLKGDGGGHVHVGYLKPGTKIKEFSAKSWTDDEVEEFLAKEEKTELNYPDFIDLVEDNKSRDFLRSKGYEAIQFHEESSMPGDDKAVYHDSVVPLHSSAVEYSHKTEIKPKPVKRPKAKKLEHGDTTPMKMRAERITADIHSDDPAKKAKAEASLEELKRWADEKNIDVDKFIRLAGELSNSFDFYYAIRNGKAKKPKSVELATHDVYGGD